MTANFTAACVQNQGLADMDARIAAATARARGPITKIRPSDGGARDAVPLVVERRSNFPEFGGYPGNAG